MGYEFEGLGVMVAIGLLSLFLIILPGAGAGLVLITWRVISADWSLTAAIVGAGIGTLPVIGMVIFTICELLARR